MSKLILIFLGLAMLVSAKDEKRNHAPEVEVGGKINRKVLASELKKLMEEIQSGKGVETKLRFSELTYLTQKGFGVFSHLITGNVVSPALLKMVIDFKFLILDLTHNTSSRIIKVKRYYLFPKTKFDALKNFVGTFLESLKGLCDHQVVGSDNEKKAIHKAFCYDLYKYIIELYAFLCRFEYIGGDHMAEDVTKAVENFNGKTDEFVPEVEPEGEKNAGKAQDGGSRLLREKTTAKIFKAWVKSAPRFPKHKDGEASDSDTKFWGKIFFSGLGEPIKNLFGLLEDNSGSEVPKDVVEGGAELAKEVRGIIGGDEKVILVRRDPSDKAKYSLVIGGVPMEALIKAFEKYIILLTKHQGCKPCEKRLARAKATLDNLRRDFLPNGAFFEEKVNPSHSDFLSGLAVLPQGRAAQIPNLPFQPVSFGRLDFLRLLERVRRVIVGQDSEAVERVRGSQLYNPIRRLYLHLHKLLLTRGANPLFLDWAINYDENIQSLCTGVVPTEKTTRSNKSYESFVWKRPETIDALIKSPSELPKVLLSASNDSSFNGFLFEAAFIAKKLKGSNNKSDTSTFFIVEQDRVEFGSPSELPMPADKVENPTTKVTPLLIPDLKDLEPSEEQVKSKDAGIDTRPEIKEETKPEIKNDSESESESESENESEGEGKDKHSRNGRPVAKKPNVLNKVRVDGKPGRPNRHKNRNEEDPEASLEGDVLPGEKNAPLDNNNLPEEEPNRLNGDKLPNQEDQVSPSKRDSVILQQDGEVSPSKRDSVIPQQDGSIFPDQSESITLGQNDSFTPGQNDSNIPTNNYSNVPTQVESIILEQKDPDVPRQKDSNVPPQIDSITPDQDEFNVPDEHDPDATEQRNSITPDQKDSITPIQNHSDVHDQKNSITPDQNESITSDEKDPITPIQNDSDVHDEKDSITSDEKDSIFPDETDSDVPKKKNSNVPEQEGSIFPDENDSDVQDETDSIFPDENDSIFPDETDSDVHDENDSIFPDETDLNVPKKKNSNVPEQEGSIFPDKNNSITAKKKNSNVPEQEGSIFPDETDSDVHDENDSIFPDETDLNVSFIFPDETDLNVSKKKNSNVPEQEGSIIPDENDSDVPKKKNSNVPEQEALILPLQEGPIVPAEKKKRVRRTVIVFETYSCDVCLNQPNRDWMTLLFA